MNSGYLIDTCGVIWLTQKQPLAQEARFALRRAWHENIPVFVSAVTAWEMGMLVARGRISETKSALKWYRDFLSGAHVGEQDVSAEIFIASSVLPQLAHKDPIDRILIATAREHDLTIITRDRAILAYGAAGHVRTLAC
ncbi:type II toxin-antitoxin system VapC family toxin [Neorhizobium sp. CSC1952]|uniref:PIN domain nuclease, a component of toxin-antitoxin system (PIN domain) n=1 Tax=Xaviernesmea oryzae TaxID=464029 RepID=A0A1X7GLX9_9HYPH|nr:MULTISPECIES: type II toxin-antitoxin system VapC family toxin [Rhizobium/Agrobacterium group]WJR66246.1 type II toxin-antitoxin system VapC family toxin [Rhizobium sp. CSC1952]SMF71780.1 PIN domain nuclease, a component of toxin-antitoxin system (PIN domain) [Xaviernesmea oryzae]